MTVRPQRQWRSTDTPLQAKIMQPDDAQKRAIFGRSCPAQIAFLRAMADGDIGPGGTNGQDPVRQDLGQPRHHRSRQRLRAAAHRPPAAARPVGCTCAAGCDGEGLRARPAAAGLRHARSRDLDHARPHRGDLPARRAAAEAACARTPGSSASTCSTSARTARASSTSSAPSRASPCPARPWSAATAIPAPMAAWARSPSASARRELVHVLATQTMVQRKPKRMRVQLRGHAARPA